MTVPGYYDLGSMIGKNSDIALKILSGDIVIEGNGVHLGGNDSSFTGIEIGNIDSLNNVTLLNLSLSGYFNGISGSHLSDLTLSNVTVSGCQNYGIYIEESRDLDIQVFTIDSNGLNSTAEAGICFKNSQNISLLSGIITNNGVTGSKNSGLMLKNCSNFFIQKTNISNCPDNGISIAESDKNTEGLIAGCIIQKNENSGISIDSSVLVKIEDSLCSDNRYNGIEIKNSRDCEIMECQSLSNLIGLTLQESQGLVASGNEFSKNRINVDIGASSTGSLYHQIDESNLVDGKKCLYLVNEQGIDIGPSDNPGLIALIDCSDITVHDIVLSKNGCGLLVASSDNIVLNRVYALNNGIGFRIGYNSRDCELLSCVGEQNLISGFFVSSSENITHNRCSVQESPSGFSFSQMMNSTINNCTATLITGPARKAPSGYMATDCEGLDFISCSANKADYAGISLLRGDDIRVFDSTVSENRVAGVVIQAKGTELVSSDIIDNKKSGVLLLADNCNITGNTIERNKFGIGIDNASSSLMVQNRFANSYNVSITGGMAGNFWNNTPVSDSSGLMPGDGGNYWSDLKGTGYSDTCSPEKSGFCPPLTINSGNIDYYPQSDKTGIAGSPNEKDLNGNGREDLQDVVVCMNLVAQNSKDSSLDFNSDLQVNLQDVVTLFRLINT